MQEACACCRSGLGHDKQVRCEVEKVYLGFFQSAGLHSMFIPRETMEAYQLEDSLAIRSKRPGTSFEQYSGFVAAFVAYMDAFAVHPSA